MAIYLKRLDLRITGVLSELVPDININLVNEGENTFRKECWRKNRK